MADYQRAQQGLPPGGYQEVQFAMLDGDHYSNIVKHEGIRGFPTIRMYSQGRMVKVRPPRGNPSSVFLLLSSLELSGRDV